VVAGREDDDLCVRDDVDEAVLVVNPPGPGTGQVVFERLGLAGEGIPTDAPERTASPLLPQDARAGHTGQKIDKMPAAKTLLPSTW